MKNLAQAITKVMKEVKGVEKNSQVGSGKMAYSGVKDQDVKEVFNKALSDNGLCILPIGIEESTDTTKWEETNQYGTKQKQSVFTKVKTEYLLLHESGESQVIVGYGHGVDSQDKGAGKATTYALKNALLYTFLTPVGKIDDTDAVHSDDIEMKEVVTPQAPTIPAENTERLPALTLDGFNYLISKGSPSDIKTALDGRRMTTDQRNQLKSKL